MAADDTTSGGGGGGLLTRRLGPLPTWGWLAIATGGGLLVYFTAKKKAASAASTTSPTSTATSASNVPDYVFQNYNVIPPTTPAPTPAPSGTPAPAPAPAPAPTPTPQSASAPSKVPWTGPKLAGMTLAAATAALQQAGYSVNNVSSGYQNLSSSQVQQAQARTVYSVTAYSNKTANIGLN